jgi:hypothetical protein
MASAHTTPVFTIAVRLSSRVDTRPSSEMPMSRPMSRPGEKSSRREITTPMIASSSPSGFSSITVSSLHLRPTIAPVARFARKPTKNRPMAQASTMRSETRSKPKPGSAKPKTIEASTVMIRPPTTGVLRSSPLIRVHKPAPATGMRFAMRS